MKNNTTFNQNRVKPHVKDKTARATALLFLKEALLREQYEDCPELIKSAKRYGARQRDIRRVIKKYIQEEQNDRLYGITERRVGRRRF